MPEPKGKSADASKLDKLDVLYWSGAALVSLGLLFDGPNGPTYALVSLGAFCLLPPLVMQLQAFLRGLKN